MSKEKNAYRALSLSNSELVRNVLELKQGFDSMLMSSSAFKGALVRACLSVNVVEAAPMRNRNFTFPLRGCEITVCNMIVHRGWILGISIETISESQLKKPLDPLGYEFGSEKISLRFDESGEYPNCISVGEIIHSRISVNGWIREVRKDTQIALKEVGEFANSLRSKIISSDS